MRWQAAVTTCDQRIENGVAKATISAVREQFENVKVSANSSNPQFGYDYCHDPAAGACGNWLLTAWELYTADPQADRYAIFQDDVRLCANLRRYLEASPCPGPGYQNLILYPGNEAEPRIDGLWYVAPDGTGLGAQGLVFNNKSMQTLLRAPYLVTYFQTQHCRDGIDGVVRSVMNWAHIDEYVHFPSLIDHVDGPSTLAHPPQPKITSFRGTSFDAMTLVQEF